MSRRLTLAHPVPNGEPNLQVQFHGENAPAPPAARKGKSGRLLLRRQRDYPAATVADFCTAVLIPRADGVAVLPYRGEPPVVTATVPAGCG